MARLPTELITAKTLTTLETETKVAPYLSTTYSVPFPLEGTVYFWLWDDGDFILWDNGNRMRK